MSRWTDEFDSHPIHGTLEQACAWSSVEVEGIDSSHEAEKQRLIKVIGKVQEIIKGMDPEFFPKEMLTELDMNLRQQGFWNVLSNYSTSGKLNHLKAANDHLSGQISLIIQLAGMSIHPESRKVISSAESAYDEFCKAIDKTRVNFSNSIGEQATEFEKLKNETKSFKNSLDVLHRTTTQHIEETASNLSTWKQEFAESQSKRTEEHTDSQIARSKEYEKALSEIKSTASADLTTVTGEHDAAFKTAFENYAKDITDKMGVMHEKHEEILTLHGLVANDGVAGGYKKGADSERLSALVWSVVSMVCYALILFWVLLKGKLGFGIADTTGIDWPMVVTTISVTAVAFISARYAGNQSRIHRMNEQRMRWFSFEIAAIDPFITSLPIQDQQQLKQQLTEKLFGQDRVIEDKSFRLGGVKAKDLNSLAEQFVEAVKALK